MVDLWLNSTFVKRKYESIEVSSPVLIGTHKSYSIDGLYYDQGNVFTVKSSVSVSSMHGVELNSIYAINTKDTVFPEIVSSFICSSYGSISMDSSLHKNVWGEIGVGSVFYKMKYSELDAVSIFAKKSFCSFSMSSQYKKDASVPSGTITLSSFVVKRSRAEQINIPTYYFSFVLFDESPIVSIPEVLAEGRMIIDTPPVVLETVAQGSMEVVSSPVIPRILFSFGSVEIFPLVDMPEYLSEQSILEYSPGMIDGYISPPMMMTIFRKIDNWRPVFYGTISLSVVEMSLPVLGQQISLEPLSKIFHIADSKYIGIFSFTTEIKKSVISMCFSFMLGEIIVPRRFSIEKSSLPYSIDMRKKRWLIGDMKHYFQVSTERSANRLVSIGDGYSSTIIVILATTLSSISELDISCPSQRTLGDNTGVTERTNVVGLFGRSFFMEDSKYLRIIESGSMCDGAYGIADNISFRSELLDDVVSIFLVSTPQDGIEPIYFHGFNMVFLDGFIPETKINMGDIHIKGASSVAPAYYPISIVEPYYIPEITTDVLIYGNPHVDIDARYFDPSLATINSYHNIKEILLEVEIVFE